MTMRAEFDPAAARPPQIAERMQDVAFAICVGFAAAAIYFANGSALLNDPDTFWHITVGRDIASNWHFPTVDSYSHTETGQPWIAKEWLSQLILFAAHALGGWHGVVAITGTAIAASGALLAGYLRPILGRTGATIACLLAIFIMASSMLARPHVLVMPVIALWTVLLARRADRAEPPPFIALPLMLLWTNMHASFAMGPILVAGFGAIAVSASAPDRQSRLLLQWGGFLAGTAALTLVTPYGAEAALLPFRMMGSGVGTEFIQEWLPLRAEGLGLVAMMLAVAMAAALACRPLANAPRLALSAFVTFQMLKHARFVLLFAVIAPVVSARACREGFERVRARFGLFRGPDPLDAVRNWAVPALAAILLCATLAVLLPPVPRAAVRPDAALAAAGPLAAERVYNDYDFGGFLIERGIRTFVDGRTDQLFNRGFRHRIEAALDAADPSAFGALLDATGVSWALVRPSDREANQLSRLPGWRRIHVDAVAAVFARS